MSRKAFIIILALAGLQSANAQFTFQSITVAGSGSSSKATTIINWGPYSGGPDGGYTECERKRREVESANSWSEPILGGKIESKTRTTPCVGPGGFSSIGNGGGPSRGSSFYSTNGVNEIKDWSNDDMERMLALNKEFKSEEPVSIDTGDPKYDMIRNKGRILPNSSNSSSFTDESSIANNPTGSVQILLEGNSDNPITNRSSKSREESNFGMSSYSGNSYTGDRYKITAKDGTMQPLSKREYDGLMERVAINETSEFIRVAKYKELPSMPTEAFAEYCNKQAQDAKHVRDLAPEVNYQLVCSQTTENGQNIQNVFVEYIIPNNTSNTLGNANNLQSMETAQTAVSMILANDEHTTIGDDGNNETQQKIQKLEAYKEELLKELKNAEGEVLFCEKMQNALELNQIEESFYIAKNLTNLGIRQIPLDELGTPGKIAGEHIGQFIDNRFEKMQTKAGIPDEPENVAAHVIEEIRDIPGIDEVAGHYLGGVAGWTIANAPEIGKSIGHGCAKMNIFFQQKEWKSKGQEASNKIQAHKRHIEMVDRAIDKIKKEQDILKE